MSSDVRVTQASGHVVRSFDVLRCQGDTSIRQRDHWVRRKDSVQPVKCLLALLICPLDSWRLVLLGQFNKRTDDGSVIRYVADGKTHTYRRQTFGSRLSCRVKEELSSDTSAIICGILLLVNVEFSGGNKATVVSQRFPLRSSHFTPRRNITSAL